MREKEGWGEVCEPWGGGGRGPVYLGGCEVFGKTVFEMVNLCRF